MTGAFAGRDAAEVDALVTDRYLETLLGAHARGADGGPSGAVPPDQIRSAARRLARDLPRLHPSFLFEEALAARLSEAASRMLSPASTGEPGRMVSLADDALADDALADDDEPAHEHHLTGRPWLLGGALTSAALSLAGAAYVAWRLNRPSSDPLLRAARVVARTRPV